MGEYKKAIDDLSQTISLENNNGKAYRYRGLIKLEIKEIEEGCRDLGIAAKLGDEEATLMEEKLCKN